MTPEAQRIAIAEVCGKLCRCNFGYGPVLAINYTGVTVPYAGQLLPDYLNDLNAMHEAEKTLTPQQADEYFIQLLRCTWKPETKQISPAEDGWLNITTFEARKVITASSAQRAEAFLAAREAKKGQP